MECLEKSFLATFVNRLMCIGCLCIFLPLAHAITHLACPIDRFNNPKQTEAASKAKDRPNAQEKKHNQTGIYQVRRLHRERDDIAKYGWLKDTLRHTENRKDVNWETTKKCTQRRNATMSGYRCNALNATHRHASISNSNERDPSTDSIDIDA